MASLVLSELKKIKRKKILISLILMGLFLPIPFIILILNGGYSDSQFDRLFQMIVGYEQLFILPLIVSVVGSQIFLQEKENNTLKNLRTIPLSFGSLIFSKLIAIFVLGLIFAFINIFPIVLIGILNGQVTQLADKLSYMIIFDLALMIGSMPIFILIAYFSNKKIFPLMLSIFYTVFNFGLSQAGLASNSPIMKFFVSIFPGPVSYRWLLGVMVNPNESYYKSVILPKMVSISYLMTLIVIIFSISIPLLLKAYRHTNMK